MRFSLFATLLFLIYSCQNGQKTLPTPRTVDPNVIALPSAEGIQPELVNRLIKECVQMDLTFNHHPASMSQTEKNAIMGDLQYISKTALATIPKSCKPFGRKVYYSNDGVIIEADIYFSEGCLFMVFIKDEKLLFANEFTEKGFNFYNGVARSVESKAK